MSGGGAGSAGGWGGTTELSLLTDILQELRRISAAQPIPAALTPAEPEIPVSEGMIVAADNLRASHAYKGRDKPSDAQIYRAMELKRREEAKEGSASTGLCPLCADRGPFVVAQCDAHTVAVGFPVNRSDGMISLHVGPTSVLLDSAERETVAEALRFPYAPKRGPQ